MKARIVLLLAIYSCIFLSQPITSWSQVQPLGTVIGNQTVISIPIAPAGYPTAQALIYYPDDYFLPANANKKYPLYIFMHGAGEGSTDNITEVTNTSLPQLIAQGLKPYAIDVNTGDTIKFIVISPHCASCGSNYSYPQLQYTIPSVMYSYRVDTSCVWVGGLSAGARGTWSVVMGNNVGDTALGKRITGIMPMANGGYDNYLGTLEPNLDTIARRGLGCLYVIGDQDPGYNSIGYFAYNTVMQTYSQTGKYFTKVIVGGTHSANVWNLPFPESAHVWDPSLNAWQQMWGMRKNIVASTPAYPPTVSAGSNQTITLPSTLTLTGTASANGGTTISSYAWTQTAGPNTASITNPASASTGVTGLAAGVYTFSLKVTASDGSSTVQTVQITVNGAVPANTPPVANAGSNQTVTLPTTTASLTGSGTDADGNSTITGYAWTQTAGPNTSTITSQTSASTTVTGLIQGTYTFQLTVTDNQSATGTATVNVVVNAAAPPSSGANTIVKVACTEYQAAWLYSDGTCRTFAFNNASGHVEFTPFQIGGRKAVDASTGFNRITILDDQGYVWLNNGGAVTAVRWNTDTTGAAFDGNTSIYGYFYTYLSIRSDGTIWYWGGDDYKFYGGTSITRPIKINQPAGVKFVKLATGNSLLGLTATGDVYEWDKGSLNYVKVNLPRPATDIAASHMNYFVAVIPDDITVSTNGWPYAWGSESKFWGGTGASYAPSAPQPLKALWNMSVPIRLIVSNQNTIHYIDANGDMYGIGDNPNGEIGNGEELVNHAEKYPTPYAWSWTKYEFLTGAPPIQIMPGTKWKNLFTGNTYVFYNYGVDVNDSLYFWGRNKSFVGGDGVVNNQEATYPNALDVLKPSLRTPLAVLPTMTAGFNFTKYTLKCPAKQTVITASAPLSATSTSSTLVTAGKPNYGYTIVKYQWTKVSGPACTITNPNALSTTVTGLTTGTYIFTIQTTDNNTGTISANDTLVVNLVSNGVPVADAGSDQTITLPTNSVTLTGTGQENGGTIVSYKWTQLAGPNTATIANSNAASTGVSGMVAGVYTFQLTITDNSGVTATATVKVTVNPAAPPGPPSANAGPDQTITLPVSSVSLSGSGAETNGAIASYKWTQVTGPNTAAIANVNAAATGVSGLIAGSYVFQLTVTDNSGVTATDVMTVTVKPAVVPGPPSANAGPDQTITLPTSSVTLAGSGAETNGTIVGYAWTQVSGPAASTIANNNQAGTGVSGLVQGTYVFQLTVTDNSGKTATDVMTVDVKSAVVTPGTPVVDAGANQTIVLPASSVTLAGTASESGGTIVTYKWTQVSGPNTANIANDAQASTGVDGLVQGAYTFQLTVTDNSGVQASDIVKITVNAPAANQPPVAVPGPDITISTPSSLPLDGSASYDPDGTIVSYQWVQTSGAGGVTITGSNTATPTIYGLQPGIYVYQLTVIDNQGATGVATIVITVTDPGNAKPVADAGHDTTLIFPGQTSSLLDGRGSTDAGGSITTYVWKQLSGPSSAVIENAAGSFSGVSGLIVGDYSFQLSITDDKGASSTATVTIHVLSDLRHDGYIRFYPNPVPMDQMITVEGSTDSASVMKFTIYDIGGRMVKQTVLASQFSTFRYTIPTTGLGRGVYVLSVEFNGGGKPQVYKFIID
jgi:hypothetical protein